jgi:hypothetical protein
MSLSNIGLEPLAQHALPLPAPQAVPPVEAALPAEDEALLVEAVDPSAVEAVPPVVEAVLLVVVEAMDPSVLAWRFQPLLEETEVLKATCPPSSKATGPRATSS